MTVTKMLAAALTLLFCAVAVAWAQGPQVLYFIKMESGILCSDIPKLREQIRQIENNNRAAFLDGCGALIAPIHVKVEPGSVISGHLAEYDIARITLLPPYTSEPMYTVVARREKPEEESL